MSDKLTDITTVVTTPDDLDLIYIVDVSDTTDDPAGTSAKITKDDLTKDKADLVHTHVKADVTDFNVVAADIDAEASTVGQVLESDGAGNAAWATPAGGGGSVAMTDITDTDLTTTPPVADDFLKFDGTNWVPAVPAGGGGGATATLEVPVFIEEVDVTNVASIDFTGIAQTYDTLIIEGNLESEAVAAFEVVYLFFNGDNTVGNYHRQSINGFNGSVNGFESNTPQIYVQGSTTALTQYSYVRIEIPFYSLSRLKRAHVENVYARTDDAHDSGLTYIDWDTTDPITSIQLISSTAANITGKLKLSGRKQVEVGGSGGGETQTIMTKQKIETISAASGDFDFTSIPAGYDKLYITGSVLSSAAGVYNTMEVEVNGDTTAANYQYEGVYILTTPTGGRGTADKRMGYVAAASAAVGAESSIEIQLEGPDDTTRWKNIRMNSSAATSTSAGMSSFAGGNHWLSTAAVNRLRFFATAGTFTGDLTLWGEKEVTVGGGGGGGATTTTVKELLDDQTDPVSGEFDFNIPSGYDKIWIEAEIYSDKATADDLNFEINGDTTQSNYRSAPHTTFANGTHFVTQSADSRVLFIPSDVQVGRKAYLTIDLRAYDDATTLKCLSIVNHSMYEATAGVSGLFTIDSSITDAVTSLKIKSVANNLLGRMRLYGEKQSTIGGSSGDPALIRVETPLETITNTTVGKFDFTNIPSSYDELVIRGTLRGDQALVYSQNRMFINGDFTDTNYFSQTIGGNNGTAFSTEAATAYIGQSSAASCPANVYSDVKISIPDYTGSYVKSYRSENGHQRITGSESLIQFTQTFHDSITDPINRLTIQTENDPTTELFGELTLYGVKYQPVNTIEHGNGPVLIETIENTTAGEFDFASIPQGYNRLYIKGYIRGDAATTTETAHMYFNADTTDANYLSQRAAAQNGSASTTEQAEPEIAVIPGASSIAGSYAQVDITIEGYAGSVLKGWSSSFSGRSDAAGLWTGSIYGSHDSMTAALTQIQVRTDNHATDQLLGKLHLYGEI